jgi:hypothetical protein
MGWDFRTRPDHAGERRPEISFSQGDKWNALMRLLLIGHLVDPDPGQSGFNGIFVHLEEEAQAIASLVNALMSSRST